MVSLPVSPAAPGGLSFRRLQVLHGVVVLGQLGAIIGAGFWLEVSPPVPVFAATLGLLAAVNLFAWRLFDLHGLSAETSFFCQLLADTAALAALLYFTGGATNPFVWLMLLSITIAATVLRKWQTWLIALCSVAAYTALMGFYRPLPGMRLPIGTGFAVHVIGMWIGFMLSAFLIAHFVAGMAAGVRVRDQALARAREEALRDERLVSLGALAAGVAHELGTPLGTLTVLAEEAALDLRAGAGDAALHKLNVMREQLRRCKQALASMATAAGAEAAQSGRAVDVGAFIESTIGEWRLRRRDVQVRCRLNGAAPKMQLVAERSLVSALTNIFDNAADASPEQVEIDADWDADALAIRVQDRGRGFRSELKARVGKALFTGKPGGHGLGLYLSQGIIDRLGGSLSIEPRRGGGTAVKVRLPMAELRV
ncbi:MAG TPA: ATP-binding protein [Gammaproteobacteria bacterium]|nr:ATP-binding protein [Gammaproteobacteria bacterium]